MFEPNEATTEALGAVPLGELAQQKEPCLLVVTGPDKGAVHKVSSGTTHTIGRSATHADIVVAGRGLSRAHATVQLRPDNKLEVVDLESTNGVFVNGNRVTTGLIADGDTLSLGPEVQLRLEFPDTTLHELISDMHRGATRDALTGVLNRRAFMQRLQQEVAASTRHGLQLCVALLDADHFKKVNDVHGHPAGDAVLVELAKRLTAGIRAEDVVARYGGEEFILMMRQTPLQGAIVLLDRLRMQIGGTPMPIGDGKALEVTVSIGVTQAQPSMPIEEIINVADQALYRAKKEGRNRVCSQPA